LTSNEQQHLVWDTASRSTKLQDALETWRGHDRFGPLATPMGESPSVRN